MKIQLTKISRVSISRVKFLIYRNRWIYFYHIMTRNNERQKNLLPGNGKIKEWYLRKESRAQLFCKSV